MVQGEPWGLHGFFSTFRLACSNLRQWTIRHFNIRVSSWNGDDLVYKWAPIKLWETNYLNKLNGVSVIYQIRRFCWKAIIIIFGDMFHSCELRVRASLISNTCFLWHSLYAFPPNTRDVSARLILADELSTKQPASSNTTTPWLVPSDVSCWPSYISSRQWVNAVVNVIDS